MNILKGLTLSLLSFLLFLSLAAFGLVFTLNSTLLDPDFTVAEVNKLDVSALSRELVGEYVSGEVTRQLPPELGGLAVGAIREAVYEVVTEIEPTLKEEVNNAIYSGYDFLLGRSEKLDIVLSLEPLKEGLRDSLKGIVWQGFQESLPPELAGLPQAQVKQYFEQYFAESYQEFARVIPSSLVIDESFLPPEAMQQIIRVREYISYVQTAYYALIGLMVLLILLIILINRNVRGSTRDLGITLLLYGAIEFAGVFLARNFLPANLPLPQIPPSLQVWVMGLTSDLLAPLQTFSIGVMAAGVVLLIVSFAYRRRVAE